ncbi:topless-related protein 4-like isoform X1 [Quercus robur]|uniref:topless-related protein 4-like isoform X1 n=1 Tax=Quercus robur TaxID=38942 RepID=UPI002163DCB9|nr:topless-related protein 4-like isoform X1 [Quercus robur]
MKRQRREMEDERERREQQRIERAERRERRSSLSLSSPDIISTLPDSILCHILSFLPIRDYVATSILSRNWKRVSTLVPSHIASHHLPTALVMTFNQGSTVNTMDFHPLQHFLLLAGTNTGDITIWEVGTRQRLVSRNFNVWDIKACSMTLQTLLAKDYTASVNRVIWSPDGALFGVAFSKHIVQIYSYHGGDDLRNRVEIDAHLGMVNDLAFSNQNRQLSIISCGEDRTIKVWDAVTGNKLYTFEGHDAPVYSVCPHPKGNIPFIISVDIDGKIKTWSYDNCCSRVDYVAWGQSCMRMAYSADGTRLFICGTSRGGESYLVEWNKCKEAIKRVYHGLWKQSVGVVQFDTMKSQFLATGDEFQIKFWDMDKGNILTTTAAEDGLPVSPCIRFNKEGVLLAVSTSQKGIKILANADGVRLLHSIENTFRVAPTTIARVLVSYSRSFPDTKPDEVEKSKAWKLTEFNEPSQLCSLQLPDCLWPVQIIGLTYTHLGGQILALASNAVHKLWKWQTSDGKATSSVPPQLWQPPSGILMTNDISDTHLERAVPCFALSKNDSYLLSTSGGKFSLFNMATFRTMTTFMSPPPAATSVAFRPNDNNTIAIGSDDYSIHIYYIRIDEVKIKLKGHQNRVTGLTFSNMLNVLVSSGGDAQLCLWSMDGWEKHTSKFLQIPPGRVSSPLAWTRVQFHQDQIHVLAVHETQIAIYEAPMLDCLKQWFPPESSGSVTDATYSCDGQLIYASIEDGSVCVLTAFTLQLRSRISPAAYLSSNPSSRAYPLVIAAHPSKPNQFAIGLTDGGVHVIEPLESEGSWCVAPVLENGVVPSANSAAGSG